MNLYELALGLELELGFENELMVRRSIIVPQNGDFIESWVECDDNHLDSYSDLIPQKYQNICSSAG